MSGRHELGYYDGRSIVPVTTSTPLPVVGTVAETVADGADVTIGAKADAASTATDTTAITAMSVWKQVSKSIQALVTANHTDLTAATPAGTNAIGNVGTAPRAAQLTVTAINFSSSGDNTVIAAGTGAQTVKVYRIYFTVAAATTITFKDGSVTDAAQTLFPGCTFALDFDGEPWFTGAAATAFKINSSSAVQVSGRIYSVTS
jgi:hypothetical protein